MSNSYSGLKKVNGEWVPQVYAPGQWYGDHYLSPTLRWYTTKEVGAGMPDVEPTFFAENRAAETDAEIIAEARWCWVGLRAHSTDPPESKRATAEECFRKAAETLVGDTARRLGVEPDEVAKLLGVTL